MKTKIYNKLVRDKIPEIIESKGDSCIVGTLGENEYIKMLDEKLFEELLRENFRFGRMWCCWFYK